jgi:hypothetical protein
MLPEPARTELRKPENMKRLYFAYQYSETEIYSALRQKRLTILLVAPSRSTARCYLKQTLVG